MNSVVFVNGFFAEDLGIGDGGAFFEPEPIAFERADQRFHMGVLFRTVKADPFAGDAAGSERILVESAGGLASIIHAKGEVHPANPIGEFLLERLVKSPEPFDSTTAEVGVPADDPAGKHIHHHDEEHLRAVGKHELSHVGRPELIDACRRNPGRYRPVYAFLNPGTEESIGSHDMGNAFSSYPHSALFPNERSHPSNPPRWMVLLYQVYHSHKRFILRYRCSLPFFARNSIHPGVQRLVRYREYLSLSTKRETRFHQV